jgi:serine phosphatase RsbU (regulator of sigma subunit)
VVLEPGEVFALFSDGIPEAQHGEDLFDDRRLHEVLLAGSPTASLDALREQVIERVREFMAEAPRTDDITLVLIRRAGKAPATGGADDTQLG